VIVLPPLVSVILLTKNAGDVFPITLDVIFGQECDYPFEVIVVDSGSSDDTLNVARRHPVELHQIRPEEFGHGRTRNLGARLAKGRYLVYLTQDAVPASRNWLSQLVANLEGDDKVAGVFGGQRPQEGADPFQEYFLQRTYHNRRMVKTAGNKPLTLENIFFSNVNSAIRKDVWQQYPFEEEIIMSEDQAWAKRVLLAGYILVYDPDAMVYHSHNYSLMSVLRRNFDSGYSLKGVTEDSLANVVGQGMAYIFGEAAFLMRRRYWKWLPYMFVFEFSRSLGFFLGSRGHLLSPGFRRRLSYHRAFWDKSFASEEPLE
jgi:rhamnosyltransferase